MAWYARLCAIFDLKFGHLKFSVMIVSSPAATTEKQSSKKLVKGESLHIRLHDPVIVTEALNWLDRCLKDKILCNKCTTGTFMQDIDFIIEDALVC